MSHNRRRNTTIVIGVLGAVVGTAFVVGNGSSLGEVVSRVGSIDPVTAAIGVACSALAIVNRGLLNRAAHRAVGLDARAADMTQTAAVGFAAQKMVKSAGAVGLAVFVRHGRRRGHGAAEVAAACVLSAAASFVALGGLLVSAVGILALTGRLTGWWIAAAVGFLVYALLIAGLVVVVIRSRRAANWLWSRGQRIRRRLSKKAAADPVEAAFPTELFESVARARRRPMTLRVLVLHALASKLLGALMLASAVSAAGLSISVGGALVIYATALGASMVTIVPGGIGTIEGSTAALLLAAGASAGAAALAVALFRLFDLWLPVLTGAVAARRRVHGDEPNEFVESPHRVLAAA